MDTLTLFSILLLTVSLVLNVHWYFEYLAAARLLDQALGEALEIKEIVTKLADKQ